MIKKLITYAVIFFMIFHFSISGVHASVSNNDVKLPNAEEKGADDQGKIGESEELVNESLQTEGSIVDPGEGDTSVETESELVEEPSEEVTTEKSFEEETETTESPEGNDNKELDSTEDVELETKDNSSDEKIQETVEEYEVENPTSKISLFSSKSLKLPYKKGDDHKDIIPVKQKLNALGFDGIAESGNYGSHTAKRVKEFQVYYGLNATGEVDQNTLDTLNAIYNSPYQAGNSNSRTTEVKKILNALGYGGLADGPVFGGLTETRVKEFQSDFGLKDHGIVDEPTYSKLKAAYNKTEFKQGDNHPGVIPIKQKLNALGFDGIAETENFGGHTAKRVSEFQGYYGLPITGVADQKTQNKLTEIFNSPYQKGNSNSLTTEIKKMLNELGYSGLAEGPAFGSLTEKRVKQFQNDYGLIANGIADEPTLSMIEKVYQEYNKTEFQQGDEHPGVIPIKQKLNALGFDGIAETGNYGGHTAKRVKEFQEYYGLSATGIADQNTQAKLDEVYNSPYQKGNSNSRTTEVKNMLNELGYNGLAEGPTFGGLTETRVKEFQSDFGLKVHGIVDEPTYSQLKAAYNKSEFKLGDDHPLVIPIKQKLNALDFGGIAETGNYGGHTAKRVKEFQKYYGLSATGIADQKTQDKLNEVYNSPYQRGKSNNYTAEIKKMLNALGYGGLADGPVFGSLTEKRLKQFQKNTGLKAHGIADEVTITKLKDAYDNRNTVESFNITLKDALSMQMKVNPQTDKYRNEPAYISSSYVNLGQKGTIISGANVNLRTQPNTSSGVNHTVGPNTTVVILGTVKGSNYNGSTEWYKVWYSGKESYTHSSLVNGKNTQMAIVTASNLNVRAGATANSHKYGSFSKGTVLEIIGSKGKWLQVPYNAWRSAKESDTLKYLDPSNGDVDMFQHLDLSSPVGATAAELNTYLKGKGILDGMGQAFVDAAKMHNINELYLVSHALLETGHGKSELSNGIVVKGKKVYNMFGIGAVDKCPEKCGSERAYDEGWDTPYKAIVGGAKFIGQKYIHNEYNQNTLYKMRWNPEGMARHGYATHQYATDIGWAEKQLSNLKKLHQDLLANPVLKFNIIKYK